MCKLGQTGKQIQFSDLEEESVIKEYAIVDWKNEEEHIRHDDVIIHMDNAYAWAKRRCYAERRRVGAVIVKGNRPISSGFNGTKSGYPNVCEKDGATLAGVTHAEKNAIFKLMESENESPKNSAIFVTTAPCGDCAEDLVLAKVSAVYFTEMYRGVEGVETLIKNNISVYHVNMKMIEDFDKEQEKSGEFKYREYPKEFLTPIYKSVTPSAVYSDISNYKIESVKEIRKMFEEYHDGKFHQKFYDVSN